MVCHSVVVGLADLELNQEFVEKRTRTLEFEIQSEGLEVHPVQFWPNLSIVNIQPSQNHVCLITGFELRACKSKYKPQLDLRLHADKCNKCMLLMLLSSI